MIDGEYNTWLIEANINPDLDTSSCVLAKLIPNLVENIFRISIDPIFPPPNLLKSKK